MGERDIQAWMEKFLYAAQDAGILKMDERQFDILTYRIDDGDIRSWEELKQYLPTDTHWQIDYFCNHNLIAGN